MITKEQFMKGLQLSRARSAFVDELLKLHVNIIDSNETFNDLESLYVQVILTEEGADWYFWYLYEFPSFGPGPQAWDEEGEPIPLDSDEDFWNFLVKYEYLR